MLPIIGGMSKTEFEKTWEGYVDRINYHRKQAAGSSGLRKKYHLWRMNAVIDSESAFLQWARRENKLGFKEPVRYVVMGPAVTDKWFTEGIQKSPLLNKTGVAFEYYFVDVPMEGILICDLDELLAKAKSSAKLPVKDPLSYSEAAIARLTLRPR